MVISAILLMTFAVAVCLVAVRVTLRVLGLGFMPTLVYLGLAEVAPATVPRRRRPR